MAGKNPTLLITGGLNKKATKDAIQSQLNKLGNELKLTIGVDKDASKTAKGVTEEKKKQLNVEKLISEAKERTARTEQKQFDLARSKTSKLLKQEIQDRVAIEKQTNKQVNAEKLVTSQLEKQREKLKLYQEEFSRRSSKLMAGQYSGRVDTTALTSLQSQVSNISIDPNNIKASTLQMQQMDSQFKNIATNAQLASRGIRGFGEDLTKNLYKFSEWLAASTLFYGVARSIQYGIQAVFELDKALTELKKVVTITDSELKNFVADSYALADALGATNLQLIESVTIFSKMGYALDEATKLGQLAVKLQTVGDGMGSMEDTANSLVSVLKGFGVDENSAVAEVTKRVDQLNAVSNEMAVSTGDITAGLQRASAGLAISGNSFEQTTALLTAGTEVLRDSEMTARGLITTSQRIYDQGTDALKQYGIETTNANGSIRSTFEILTDLHNILPTLTEDQQRWILTTISGKDQFKTIAAIMQNWNAVAKTMEVQMNANGSATEELNRKLDSLEGRVNKMTNAFSKFWTSAIDNNLVKTVISGITGLVDIFTTLNTASQGTLLPLSLLFIALSKFTNINLASVIAQWVIGLTSFESVVGTTTVSVNAFGLSIKGVYALMGVFGAVLIAGSAIYNQYQKDVQKTREETEKFKVAQEQLKETLSKNDNLSAKTVIELESLSAKYEQATLKAKELRAEILAKGGKQGSSEYKKLQDEIQGIEVRFKELGTTAQGVKANIDLYNKSVAESKKQNDITAESLDHLSNRMSESVNNYALLDNAQKEFKENGYLTQSTIEAINEKYGKFIDVTKLSGNAIIDFINTNKKAITQGIQDDIAKTDSAIAETKRRIEAMKAEMKAYALLTSVKADSAEGLQAEKMYIHGNMAGGALNQLELLLSGLESNKGNLKNTLKELADVGKDEDSKDSESTKQKITLLTELEKKLLINNSQLEIQRSKTSMLVEGSKEWESSLREEIKLLDERQILLDKIEDVDSARLKALKSKKGLTDEEKKEIEEIQGKLRDYGDEWWSLEATIKSVNKSIVDATKKANEEIEKSNEKLIEDTKDLHNQLSSALEKQAEEELRQKKERADEEIKDVEEKLRKLEELYSDDTHNIEEAELTKEITKLEKQRQMELIEGSTESGKRIYEIDEKLVELRKKLSELDRKQDYEIKKRALEDEKRLIQENLDAEERAFDKKKREFQYLEDAKQMILNNSTQQMIAILQSFDKDFALDGKTKGQKWLDEFAIKVAQAQALLANLAGATVQMPSTPSGGTGGGSSSSGGSASGGSTSKPSTSTPSKSNQQKYLENLASGGTKGQQTWAKDQLAKGKYANGGIIPFTDLAMVHGSPSLPELALNSNQISKVASSLGISGNPAQQASALYNYAKSPMMSPNSGAGAGSNIVINLNMNNNISNNMDINTVNKQMARGITQELNKRGIRL